MLSLVIPTYNEAKNIEPLVQGIERSLGTIPHEILIVDDDSPDGTAARAQSLKKTYPSLRVIERKEERGLGSAVLRGFDEAEGEVLGVMDADLSHDAALLPELYAAIAQGVELAVGSRRLPGGGADHWPWYRQLASTVATGWSKLLLRLSLSDPMSGYFMVSRPFYESCKKRCRPQGYKILLEIYCKGRPTKVVERPYVFRDRQQNESKMSLRVIRQYLQMVAMLSADDFIQNLRRSYHTGRYRKVAAQLKPGTVLDIGCGQPCETMPDGAFLRFLGRGTGLDLKPCDIPFEFVQADILKMPFSDHHFDNIVAMEVLEHQTDPHRAMKELKRVLKTDGHLVVSFPDENPVWEAFWWLWENSFGYLWKGTHTGTMHSHEWQPILKQHFKIDHFQRHWYFNLLYRLRP